MHDSSGCQCVDYNCGCCAYMHIPKIGLDDTGVCASKNYCLITNILHAVA